MNRRCTSGKCAHESAVALLYTRILLTLGALCRGVQQSMTAGFYAVTLTVRHPYAGYAQGKQIRLKCSAKVTRDKVVETIQNFQRHGPWLEQSEESRRKEAHRQAREVRDFS